MIRERTLGVGKQVVLRMGGGSANPLVVEAAVRVARALRGELRGMFVEDEDLLALADLPFAREISISGAPSRPLTSALLRKEMQAASQVMQQVFDRLVDAAQVSAAFEIVHDATQALHALQKERVILAIGEPVAVAGAHMLPEFNDFAGLVVVGQRARRARGPIVAAVEGASDTARIVDTAEDLAREQGREVVLVIAAADHEEFARLSKEIRDALDPDTRFHVERAATRSPQELRLLARRYDAGLVMTQIGSSYARDPVAASRLVCLLDCPLLLLN